MKRRHRETAGGEVAMMAVITKAMGAFLVLMIMLLPYYTGDTQSQQTVDETRQRIDEAKNGLDGAIDRLRKGRLSDAEIDDLLKRLTLARDELTDAQSLIAQLKIKVDQLASQINRLEQQNTALQNQVAALQREIATLQAEVEALRQEIARLRAIDSSALQARIRELEAEIEKLKQEIAKLAPLQNQLAAQARKIEGLEKELEEFDAENAVLRAMAAQPKIYLSAICDGPNMIVDLLENPIGIKNFKTVDQYIPRIMPWAGAAFDQQATRPIKGDNPNSSITNVIMSFEDGQEFQYDFFIRFNRSYSGQQATGESYDRYYAELAGKSPKNSDGAVSSTESHPSCNAVMLIYWHDNLEQVGVFRVGPVEPVVHVRRILFSKDRKISYPPDDRPNIEQLIAKETCARYPPFCALAAQHAKLRAQVGNPWDSAELNDSSVAPPRRASVPPVMLPRPSLPSAESKPRATPLPADQPSGPRPPPRPTPRDTLQPAPKQ